VPLPTGFSLEYPAITLHAVSPASDNTPAYLYCQVDDPSAKDQSAAESAENSEGEEDEDVIPMREMKVFVRTTDQRK
jgi:nucleotide-sensitive chloride channel 1A